MATKAKQTGIEKATTKVLGLTTKANNFALSTTEKAFDTSFGLAHKSLDLTSKVIKKGLDITATQQDLVFDVLNGIKKRIIKN
ncbi:hypothetical protein [Flagellimonas sp.]|uniref:hypothetical protein n=1 Tax=Flagellimonas sp. TaxID=2058762 RepID=UPI003F49C467